MTSPISVSGSVGTAVSYANAISAGVLVYSGYAGIYVLGFDGSNTFANDIAAGMLSLEVGTDETEVFGSTSSSWFHSGVFDITAIVVPQSWPAFSTINSTGFSQLTFDTAPWASSGSLSFFASVGDALSNTYIQDSFGQGYHSNYNVASDGISGIWLSREPSEDPPGEGFAINSFVGGAASFGMWTGGDVFQQLVNMTYFSGGGGGALCFVEGTQIAVPSGGTKAIETFSKGDAVRTHLGAATTVDELYHSTVDTAKFPMQAPVRIPVGTLGATANVDMTPRHGIVVPAPNTQRGWTLIPAANYPGITAAPGYDGAVVHYWHLKLASGETLTAGGVACESWRCPKGSTWGAMLAHGALYRED